MGLRGGGGFAFLVFLFNNKISFKLNRKILIDHILEKTAFRFLKKELQNLNTEED